MGTRSLTHFTDDDGSTLTTVYRQMDGYPEGQGKDLAEILKGRRLVNGYSPGEDAAFNGMGCLAAAVVAGLKDGIGSIYIFPPDAADCGEDYVYTIKPGEDGAIVMSVAETYGAAKVLWEGSPDDFRAFLEQHAKDNDE